MRLYMNTAMKNVRRMLHVFMQTDRGSTVGYCTRHRVSITTTERGVGVTMVVTLKYNTNWR